MVKTIKEIKRTIVHVRLWADELLKLKSYDRAEDREEKTLYYRIKGWGVYRVDDLYDLTCCDHTSRAGLNMFLASLRGQASHVVMYMEVKQ